ncbi:nucleotidyltransferase family protein [Actinocrinis sp.]|uniref:nucleotidyltransferase family protein n=1 Tax=Actinocrinis sp. TaxID=1920516 RepID=UPI002CF921F5|nr:nucleotidyltransferase family protein [Actinocrinis sp.]HXR72339.1 nucleotidyltransferase family protein [Actinocrinis sp.]
MTAEDEGVDKEAGTGVAALILAAGAGTRMGGPKALLEFRGRLLIERAIDSARAGGCGQVMAVLGAAAGEVQRRADLRGARVVVNQGWNEGIGSSLRAGLAELTRDTEVDETETAAVDASLVLLVDQPLVGADAVRAVLGAWRAGARLAAASYGGRRGHPVLLGREHWSAAAREAAGDVGARAFLAAHAAQLVFVPCDAIADPRDLDVPADLNL